jgi:hypothetical protein
MSPWAVLKNTHVPLNFPLPLINTSIIPPIVHWNLFLSRVDVHVPLLIHSDAIGFVIQTAAPESGLSCLRTRRSSFPFHGIVSPMWRGKDNRGLFFAIMDLLGWQYRWRERRFSLGFVGVFSDEELESLTLLPPSTPQEE